MGRLKDVKVKPLDLEVDPEVSLTRFLELVPSKKWDPYFAEFVVDVVHEDEDKDEDASWREILLLERADEFEAANVIKDIMKGENASLSRRKAICLLKDLKEVLGDEFVEP